jgi:hypothetical protein
MASEEGVYITQEQYEEYQKLLVKKERDKGFSRAYMARRRAEDKEGDSIEKLRPRITIGFF